MTWPPSPQELFAIWSRDLGRARPFVDDPSQALVLSGVSGDMGRDERDAAADCGAAGRVGFRLSVLAPLSAALTAAASCRCRAPRRNRPWLGARSSATRCARAMRWASRLLTGDFVLGATGTVTHVDGDRVYGFGHPLYNLGPTEFPLTKADVQVVLPSLMSSSKLASFGEVVGTVQQDRATAVAGRLGAGSDDDSGEHHAQFGSRAVPHVLTSASSTTSRSRRS